MTEAHFPFSFCVSSPSRSGASPQGTRPYPPSCEEQYGYRGQEARRQWRSARRKIHRQRTPKRACHRRCSSASFRVSFQRRGRGREDSWQRRTAVANIVCIRQRRLRVSFLCMRSCTRASPSYPALLPSRACVAPLCAVCAFGLLLRLRAFA